MADNYDILEPTSAPSGTTTRTVRAIDVGSGELAGAAVLVDTSGVALVGQQARTASLPVTLSNSDIVDIAPYRVSTFSTANPTGVHVPTLPSGVTNDVLIAGTTQPVTGNYTLGTALTWVIPVGAAGYTSLSIGIWLSGNIAGGTCSFNVWPSTSTGTNVGLTISHTIALGSNFNQYYFPAQGATLAAGGALSANINAAMPWNAAPPYVSLQMGGSSVTGPNVSFIVTRIK